VEETQPGTSDTDDAAARLSVCMFLSDYHTSNSEYRYWKTEFKFINKTSNFWTSFNNPSYTVNRVMLLMYVRLMINEHWWILMTGESECYKWLHTVLCSWRQPKTNTCTTHMPTQTFVSVIYRCRQITPGIGIGTGIGAGQKYRYRKYR